MDKLSLIGQIDELRKAYMNFVKDKAAAVLGEEWPEYVLKDWLYKQTKDMDPAFDTPEGYKKLVKYFLDFFIKRHGKGKWILDEIIINIDVFDPETKDMVLEKMGKNAYRYNGEIYYNDNEKYEKQKELLLKHGISNEPIIVIKKKNGIYLMEGWHRTIESLKLFGEYKQLAYVYVT